MLFSSIPFLYYFLPSVLIAYYLVPKPAKNMVLLLASLVFYGWGEPVYVFLMVGTIVIAYSFGLLIEKNTSLFKKKMYLIASLVMSLGILGYFKYADFFITNEQHYRNESAASKSGTANWHQFLYLSAD